MLIPGRRVDFGEAGQRPGSEARDPPRAPPRCWPCAPPPAPVGPWRLDGCTLVVTLEPCTMCAGALVLARVSRLVYGADDPKAGAVGSLWDVVRDRRLNSRPEVVRGVLAGESTTLLRGFFAAHRNG